MADERFQAGSVIDALAEKGYISDHLATDPMTFYAMVDIAAEALRERQRQLDSRRPGLGGSNG